MKIAKHCFTIQPFKVFEGLLKPRNIDGRKEKYKEEIAKKYPDKIMPSNQKIKDLERKLSSIPLPSPFFMVARKDFIEGIKVFYTIGIMKKYPGAKYSEGGIMGTLEVAFNKNNTFDFILHTSKDSTYEQVLNNVHSDDTIDMITFFLQFVIKTATVID